jgi:integrase
LFYRRLPDNNESPRKICEITLGRFEDLQLEQARKKATELNYLVGLGKDPSLARQRNMTYGQLFSRYIEEYAKLHTATWQETVKNHKRYFTQWEKRTPQAITREHVQTWVNLIGTTKGKFTANRQYNTFRAVIGWGLSLGLIEGDNPCIGIKLFRTLPRERFLLPGAEFQKFADSLNQEEPTIRDFFWMCLFTGARCSNVLSMEWSQINMELQQWRIPRTKNGDSHTIPLTIAAMQILRIRNSDHEAHERWVFPTDRKGWKTGERGHLVAPRNAFKRIRERAGIQDLRIHDLRRTAGSYMAMQNVSLTIIGQALGHRSPQSTAVYARLTDDPVREALEKAQEALANPKLLLKREAPVIPITKSDTASG